MLDFCIIGSGISGSTIASNLKKNTLLKFLIKPEALEAGVLLNDIKVK